MGPERLDVNPALTKEFHDLCSAMNERGLSEFVDRLPNGARIGFMDGEGEDAEFIDNTSFYADRSEAVGVFLTNWDGWKGDLVWTVKACGDTCMKNYCMADGTPAEEF